MAAYDINSSTTTSTSAPLHAVNSEIVTILQTTELSGVQVAIIIAAGITTFLVLSILAQRQIQRMLFCKHLHTAAVPKIDQFPGVNRDVSLRIRERMLRSCDVDGHVFAWSEKFNRPFFREENPVHFWRAKALDQCNRLLPVLHSFGGLRYTWLSHECVDEFLFMRRKDFPYTEIDELTLEAFGALYKKLRFGEGKFNDSHYHRIRRLVDDIIADLLLARHGMADNTLNSTVFTTEPNADDNYATMLNTSGGSVLSSAATANRTFVDSKLNMSEASGKAMLLPRAEPVDPSAVLGSAENNMRDRRVSPLGYERLSPEALARFPGVNFYLTKVRNFVRGGRLAPPSVDELTEQMPLQLSATAARHQSGRTGPAALLEDDNGDAPWLPQLRTDAGREWSASMSAAATPAPIIIPTPEPTRRAPLMSSTQMQESSSMRSTSSEPQLAAARRRSSGTPAAANFTGASVSGVDSGTAVHRRMGRIFSVGLAKTTDENKDAAHEEDLEEMGDDGGRKDLLRQDR